MLCEAVCCVRVFCRGFDQEPHILPCLSQGWVLYDFQRKHQAPRQVGSGDFPASVDETQIALVQLIHRTFDRHDRVTVG